MQHQFWYKCLEDRIQRAAAAWCCHLANLACREKQISIGINLTLSLSNQIWKWSIFFFALLLQLFEIGCDMLTHSSPCRSRSDPALYDFKEKGLNEWIAVITCPEFLAWMTVLRRLLWSWELKWTQTHRPPRLQVSPHVLISFAVVFIAVSKSLYIQADKALTCYILWILTDPCHKHKSVLRHYLSIRYRMVYGLFWTFPIPLWK